MKIPFWLVTLYLSHAQAALSPCDSFLCSQPQQDISAQYESALPISPQSPPSLYSGNCFHTAFGYDNNDTHHAMVLLDRKDGATYFFGQFAMFNKADPYLSLNIDKAREYLKVDYSPKHILTLNPTEGFIEFNPNMPPIWQYYVRTNSDESKLFLYGRWSLTHSLLCELKRHN